MNRLYLAEVRDGLPVPDFGGEFPAHIARLANPRARAESLTAWNLLARAVAECGERLPTVAFGPRGKPLFTDSPLRFSLSHSGNLAAALISEKPCGVDVQILKTPVSPALIRRVLTDREQDAGLDFHDVWTKKECIAKLDGQGLRLRDTDVSDYAGRNWLLTDVFDPEGQKYRLAALCTDEAGILRCY